ncbi:MAG: CBS domain-containing protein [Candidatus Saccharimonadales bacterium]
MFTLVFGSVFAVFALVAIGLQRTYYHIPVKELKRRARGGDQLAEFLYRPLAYGVSLKGLLWGMVIIFSSLAFVCFAKATAAWFAFFLIAFFIWLGFLWIPSGQLTSFGARIAIWLTPAMTWLVRVLHPVIDWLAAFVRKHRPLHVHTGLYEKEDLVELLEQQKHQADSKISAGEIAMLQHALTFGDKRVRDVLVPRRAVRLVSGDETIGPLLMDELHKSGYSRFPVYGEKQESIVGTLYMRDMLHAKQGGKVASVARSDVFYVNEEFTLYQALQAFLKTKHHLFVVVNSFEEFVGIITIEDILEQVIGRQIVDEFDQYDNMREVAAAAAKKDNHDRKKANKHVEKVVE